MRVPPVVLILISAVALAACASNAPGEARGAERDAPVPAAGTALNAPRPPVFSRSRWGAAPLDTSNASPMNGISRLTVHHTGEPRPAAAGSVDDAARRMRSYQTAHVEGRGWADIGYHFVIDPSGRVWRGRPIAWQGAHAGNGPANQHNVGISLMGNFDLQPVPPAQRTALAAVVHWLVDEYGILPDDIYTHSRIKAEYGLPGTACPGKDLDEVVRRLQAECRRGLPQT